MTQVASEKTMKGLAALIEAMPPDKVDALARHVTTLQDAKDHNPMPFMAPTVPQLEAFSAFVDYSIVLFSGGNGSGKSYIGAYASACTLEGEDPARLVEKLTFPAPKRRTAGVDVYTKVWVGSVTVPKGCEMLRQTLIPMLPKDSIAKPLNQDGYMLMKSGAMLQVKSYDQSVESWQSDAVDLIWLYEQCSREIFYEAISRVARREGRIFMTLTPVHAAAAWMTKELFMGMAGLPVYIVKAHQDTNVYLSEKTKKIFSIYKGTAMERTVLGGEPSSLQGAIHPWYNPKVHKIAPFFITPRMKEFYKFGLVCDLHPASVLVAQWFMFSATRPDPTMKKEYPPELYDMLAGPHCIQIKEYNYEQFDLKFFCDALAVKTQNMGITLKVTFIDTALEPSANKSRIIPMRAQCAQYGLKGLMPNHSISTGILRLNEYGMNGGFYIFNTCEQTDFSIQTFSWPELRGAGADYRNQPDRPVCKDEHWVRNIHYMLCYMKPYSNVVDYLSAAKHIRANRAVYGNVMNEHSQ